MRIITRQSKLALLQVEEVMRQYPDVHYELMKTSITMVTARMVINTFFIPQLLGLGKSVH